MQPSDEVKRNLSADSDAKPFFDLKDLISPEGFISAAETED